MKHDPLLLSFLNDLEPGAYLREGIQKKINRSDQWGRIRQSVGAVGAFCLLIFFGFHAFQIRTDHSINSIHAMAMLSVYGPYLDTDMASTVGLLD